MTTTTSQRNVVLVFMVKCWPAFQVIVVNLLIGKWLIWNMISLSDCGPCISVLNLPCPEIFSWYSVWFSEIICKLSWYFSEVQDIEACLKDVKSIFLELDVR